VWIGVFWELPLLSAQFYLESKTALQNEACYFFSKGFLSLTNVGKPQLGSGPHWSSCITP
jgi:hypothetical protein